MTSGGPRGYSVTQRLVLLVVPFLASGLLRLLFATCRKEVIGREHFDGLEREDRLALGALWHETLGLTALFHQGKRYCTLTSLSFDGELAARFMGHLGFESVRGSSSRGGAKALIELSRAVEGSPGVAYTLDGPRGPRRTAQPGIGYVSMASGMPVLPIVCVAQHCWRLNSWDRLAIPKPFSRVVCAYAEPVEPPQEGGAEASRAMARQVAEVLNRTHAEIEQALGVDPLLDAPSVDTR